MFVWNDYDIYSILISLKEIIFVFQINMLNVLVITRFVDSYWYCTMWDRLLTHRKLTAVLSVCVLEKVENHTKEK